MTQLFERNIISLYGVVGKKWLTELPEIIEKYKHQWELTTLEPFSLSYNYVCSAIRSDGTSVVLKISHPNNNEFLLEVAALKRFKGDSCVDIIEVDDAGGALLLERADPGAQIRKVEPETKQIHLASEVMERLIQDVIAGDKQLFPSVTDWMKVLDRYKTKFTENQGPIGKKTIDKGERIFKELMSDSTENLLLHGDLHNDNILSSQRGWLAIDPKGVIGVREFEIGVYLRNPFYDLPKNSDHRKVETRRISQFAEELNLDKKRIKNWTMVCAVLSLLWSWEDSGSINSLYQQSFELLDEIKV